MKIKITNSRFFLGKRLLMNLIRTFVFLCVFSVFGTTPNKDIQGVPISGKITDSAGEPLPGANILEKGTTNGTQSDFDGNFSLNLADRNATLVVSYLGFVTKEVTIENPNEIYISLEENATGLDEVLVVGYGTQKKSDITGSVAVVSSEDFENQPISRVDQALQGRTAGVQVSQTSGEPGSGFKIRIRGTNSINGSNDPLYVVDGMVVGSISTLNSNDIKSLEILKDASSTAVYGSRGANGVVLVTTKNGRDGKLKVDFNAYTGMQTIRKRLDIMNGADFAEMVNVADTGVSYSEEEIIELRENGGTDWQDEIFRTAAIKNYQLSVTGGNAKTNYYVSGGYFGQDGIVKDQDYKRYSLRSKLNTEFSKKLNFDLNIYLSREEKIGEPANVNSAVTFDPTTPVYDADGNFNFSSLKNAATGDTNPLIATKLNTLENFNNQAILGTSLTYKLTDNITFRTLGGLEYTNGIANSYVSMEVDQLGTAGVTNSDQIRIQNTNMVTYDKEFENQNLKVDLIHEQQYIKSTYTTASAVGFPTDESSYRILSLGTVQKTSNFTEDSGLQSFVGRVNYGLFDKYLFTGTVRADGSSKFRKDNRWGVFPSASLAWKVSEEDFLKDVEFINSLKVRGSYGLTGSQAIEPLATRSRAVYGTAYNYPFDGETPIVGIGPSDIIENPDLTWEKTLQSNIGFDFGILNSKYTMSFDWYKKNTSDLLLLVTLPEFIGANLITENIGEIENKGFDISIGANLIQKADFSLSTNFNFSKNSNKVLSLVDDTPISNLGDSYLGSALSINPTHIEVGQPLGTFRGYVFEGVYQTGEETLEGFKAGDPIYKDLDGDGFITTEDIQNIGNGSPDYTWGLNTDIVYKDFSLNILVQGSKGNDVYNFIRARQMGLGSTTFHAVHEDIKNSWTTSNPSNIPALDKTAGSHQILSSEFLEDASYIRFKNITLGYNLRPNILSKLGIESMRLYMSFENLITITDYTGYDPEVSSGGNSDIDLGIDWDAYPLARTISVGLNVSL
ncbi:SusC/RagA family TonB-linked outer membrane protein [Maribacter polysiphoniae]|uniref:SusC/RagA family TonB-linked outer membrane protein n=1 Tax=Maribacter polysiphoniae TaxID=429344 RepID=UPI002355C4E2|nr:TonB-dependent receptor [Maribacter polysiphoniae]